jgi:hypothetical protein
MWEPPLARAPSQLNSDISSSAAFSLYHSRPGTVSLSLSENDDDPKVKSQPGYGNLEFLITTGRSPPHLILHRHRARTHTHTHTHTHTPPSLSNYPLLPFIPSLLPGPGPVPRLDGLNIPFGKVWRVWWADRRSDRLGRSPALHPAVHVALCRSRCSLGTQSQVVEGMGVVSTITAVPTFRANERTNALNMLAQQLGDDRAAGVRRKYGRPFKAVIIQAAGELPLPPGVPAAAGSS